MAVFDKAFYTVPEVAEILRIHENTVYNWIRKNKIEFYRVGSQYRITAQELERLRVPASDPAELNNTPN